MLAVLITSYQFSWLCPWKELVIIYFGPVNIRTRRSESKKKLHLEPFIFKMRRKITWWNSQINASNCFSQRNCQKITRENILTSDHSVIWTNCAEYGWKIWAAGPCNIYGAIWTTAEDLGGSVTKLTILYWTTAKNHSYHTQGKVK